MDTLVRHDNATPQAGSAAGGSLLEEGIDLVDFSTTHKAVIIGVLIAIAIISFFPVGNFASSVDTHAATIQTIDAKKDTVMGLVASSTGASVAVSFLPGDAGTPIAEKLVDISSDFLVVIAALYLEKYLLTLLGFAAFKILIPISCLLVIIALLLQVGSPVRPTLTKLASKLTLCGLAVFLAVPASVFVSGMIDQTYEASIAETIAAAEQTAGEIDAATGNTEAEGDKSILDTIAEKIQEIPGGVASLVEQAKDTLNSFIEALAVMIVTSCVIPILVLVFFLWLVKVILGLNIEMPMGLVRPRTFTRRIGR